MRDDGREGEPRQARRLRTIRQSRVDADANRRRGRYSRAGLEMAAGGNSPPGASTERQPKFAYRVFDNGRGERGRIARNDRVEADHIQTTLSARPKLAEMRVYRDLRTMRATIFGLIK